MPSASAYARRSPRRGQRRSPRTAAVGGRLRGMTARHAPALPALTTARRGEAERARPRARAGAAFGGGPGRSGARASPRQRRVPLSAAGHGAPGRSGNACDPWQGRVPLSAVDHGAPGRSGNACDPGQGQVPLSAVDHGAPGRSGNARDPWQGRVPLSAAGPRPGWYALASAGNYSSPDLPARWLVRRGPPAA